LYGLPREASACGAWIFDGAGPRGKKWFQTKERRLDEAEAEPTDGHGEQMVDQVGSHVQVVSVQLAYESQHRLNEDLVIEVQTIANAAQSSEWSDLEQA
jgi:hypothetical protein